MKLKYLEPFVHGACQVLSRVSADTPAVGAPGLSGGLFQAACVNIAARVEGSLCGSVIYSMSTRTACKLTTMVLGTEHHVFGRQVGGALSRLGDELSDTTMQLLSANGIECSITSPTVFQGMNIEFSSPSPALAVPIRMAAGQVDIIVAVDGERLAHKRI